MKTVFVIIIKIEALSHTLRRPWRRAVWWCGLKKRRITGLYMLRSLRSLRGSGQLGHSAARANSVGEYSHIVTPAHFVRPA
jgi:hypothetical protein